jgi:hypothetical protein
MTRSTAVPRLAPWKVALGSVAVAAALLALTGAANAAVINVSPGTATASGKDNLSAAIITANGNGAASNTIVLAPGKYQPVSCSPTPCTPTAPSLYPTISGNLTITGDHALQASGQASTLIDASLQASSSPGNLLTISGTGNLTLEAVEIDSGGGAGFSDISDSGTLTTWGVTISSGPGAGIGVTASTARATLNETTLAAAAQNQINNAGSLTLNNSTVAAGAAIGIANSGGTFALNNTLMAFQVGVECNGGTATNGATDGSLDDDATCGVQHSNITSVDTGFPGIAFNGGPTATYQMPAGSATDGAGNAPCPTTDQRFFVQTTACDIGAETRPATRNTTPPSCTVTGTNPGGTPPTQTVTLSDAGSGMGPESGTAYDPNSQTSPQPQNARAAASVPSDGISGLGITNGTVAISTLPTAPTRSSITLTASKTTLGTLTQWWFTATDWAGNVKFCQ